MFPFNMEHLSARRCSEWPYQASLRVPSGSREATQWQHRRTGTLLQVKSTFVTPTPQKKLGKWYYPWITPAPAGARLQLAGTLSGQPRFKLSHVNLSELQIIGLFYISYMQYIVSKNSVCEEPFFHFKWSGSFGDKYLHIIRRYLQHNLILLERLSDLFNQFIFLLIMVYKIM